MSLSYLTPLTCRPQARARGYLWRAAVRRARADFEELVRELDGTLAHLRWRDAPVSIPHFTDTDGPLQSPAAPHCPETQAPERLTEDAGEEGQRPPHQPFPQKVEAERDGLGVQKEGPLPRVWSPGIPAGGGVDQTHADGGGRSHREDGRGSVGDCTTSTVWSSEEADTAFAPSHGGPQQQSLAQDVPRTPEALRHHRNALSMELLWLQQAIASRKKVK
ncbi:hypothetical protein N1851_004972 [Merluccius polli]|uniref:IQ domain-containing protein C n=1 Tax=Merluccius polli TaxID=89951 RepID=A0AA47N7R1_MERPO|nr:hypothetical protein N1851_004972 [Merluccius polli]